MFELYRIKQHIDAHGIGCAIRDDHVAVSMHWTSHAIGGETRHLETTARVRSLEEACQTLGCGCRLREPMAA